MAQNTSRFKNINKYKTGKKGLLDINTPKEFLIFLLISGGVVAAMSITPALLAPAVLLANTKIDKKSKKKFRDTFYYLKQRGLILTNNKKIYLTKKGLDAAIRHYVNSELERKKQGRTWNNTWWILIFDIPHDQKTTRDALRYFVKKLGMIQLQKSAWIYPFDCSGELQLIKDFFDLKDDAVRLIVSKNIGSDKKFKKIFDIT